VIFPRGNILRIVSPLADIARIFYSKKNLSNGDSCPSPNSKHLAAGIAPSRSEVTADRKILRDFLKIVPSNGALSFLRTNNFTGFSFDHKRLDDIDRFFHNRSGPDHEFLNSESEMARKNFRESCKKLLVSLGLNTSPTGSRDYQEVPDDWEVNDPRRFQGLSTKFTRPPIPFAALKTS
jgi:hypothetical protein